MSDLDETRLGQWLEANVAGLAGPFTVEKFPGGQSNPTYRIDAASGSYVLRRKPFGPILPSAHAVEREYRLIAALHPTGFPVARPYGLCEDLEVIGSPFYIMEMVEGRTLWDGSLPGMAPADRTAHYDAITDTLAALHSIDHEAVGLGDYGKPGNYFARQIGRWSSQYRASETGTVADMDRLIGWLETHLPADDGLVSLVHGDYRLDNMMFAPDRPAVIAVLDWELSTLGHPYADIAYQCMQWRLSNSSSFRGLGGIDRQALGIPSEEAYVERYCERRGLSGIDNWTFCLAFSFFRLAAICQGVYKRALDGNASNPEKAKTYGSAVELLSGLAMETIGKEA